VVCIAVVGLALSPTTVLEVADARQGTVLLRLPLAPGQGFVLAYTHSMYQVEVQESYRFDPPHGLVLAEVTSSPAALEYYALTATTPLGDGRARASNLNLPVGEFVLRGEVG